MAEIFVFKSSVERSCATNLQEFIRRCREDLTVFGSSLDWEHWLWPKAGNFTKLGIHSRSTKIAEQLDAPFIDFAKAYFRYQQGHNPTGARNELKALRAVEAALLQRFGRAELSDISGIVLDDAAQIAREHFENAVSAYQCGRELQRLGAFVHEHSLVHQDCHLWKSPIRKPPTGVRTGKKAKELRDQKLPPDHTTLALADIFATHPTAPRDLFTSSTFAMLMSSPCRITEVLELPVDCLWEEYDKDGVLRHGYRYYAGKGFAGDVKWILTPMVTIAKEAVRRIQHLTEPGRALARWIENNPDEFYRHPGCPNVGEQERLSPVQACQALGLSPSTELNARARLRSLKAFNDVTSLTLAELWTYVKSRLPEGFPYANKKTGLKYSNALFCMLANQLHAQRGISPVVLWFPTHNVLNNDLSPRESLGPDAEHASIFDRYDCLTPDGKRMKLTSHQMRHLLNTMAQRGGLSQEEIAKWAGRADIKQNQTYNHISDEEIAAEISEATGGLALYGNSAVDINEPITREESELQPRGPAHKTIYGMCLHDWLMSPCGMYRDCLNCEEHACVKRNDTAREEIEKRLRETELQLAEAEQAVNDEYMGADRWYEHHKKSVDRMRALLAIMDDPSIEDGAMIRLQNDNSFSILNRALSTRPLDLIATDASKPMEISFG